MNIGLSITSINLAAPAMIHNIAFWEKNNFGDIAVACDLKTKGPSDNNNFYILTDRKPKFSYEKVCPYNSYSRKNISFLELFSKGANFIFETDDDNQIYNSKINDLTKYLDYKFEYKRYDGVQNIFSYVYSDFSDNIWARGFPIRALDSNINLNIVNNEFPSEIGVVQYLVDGNPDVDAIIRLVKSNNIQISAQSDRLPLHLFNQFHPINSQATLWSRNEFVLMYLPSTCTFRMTDIWRGYIAQKILYSNKKTVVFDIPIVNQIRNEHIVSSDFFSEYNGYNESLDVINTLIDLNLDGMNYFDSMYECYYSLYKKNIFDKAELVNLDAWLNSIKEIL